MQELMDRLSETARRRSTKFKTHTGEEFDRSEFLTASESWNCARQIWFSKHLDYDPKSSGWGFFERGHNVEAWVVDLVKEAGYELMYSGKDQVTLVLGNLSATPDGLLNDGVEQIIIEIKSIDPRSKQELPKHEHVMQVQLQMVLFNHLDEFDASPERAWIMYVDASDYSKIQVFEVKYDASMFDKLSNRADMILGANTAMSVPAEGKVDGSCKFCAFTDECGEAIIESLPTGDKELDGEDLAAMNSMLIYRQGAYIAEKKAATHRKEAEEKIKAFMTDMGRAKIVCDGYSVSYTEVAGRKTLDKKRLEEEFGDLDEYYNTGKPTTRLSIAGG